MPKANPRTSEIVYALLRGMTVKKAAHEFNAHENTIRDISKRFIVYVPFLIRRPDKYPIDEEGQKSFW